MQLALKTKADDGLFQRLFHWLTKWRLLTEYPHAGIVHGGMLMHSNLANGLHAQTFDPLGWVLIDIPTPHDVGHLFSQHRGTAYDWFSLLAFVLPWRVRDGDRMYCYEWCWLAMTGEMPACRVTPEMLLTLAHQMNKGVGK